MTGLASEQCSGKCRGGYYCVAGSTSETQVPCSGNQFCPPGSEFPLFVSDGFYTTVSDNYPDHSNISTKPLINQERQYECPEGYFCHRAVRYPCSAGTYGSRVRETNSSCSGKCEAGYYCRQGSTRPRQQVCGNPSYYCPTGSISPQLVQPGFYTLSEKYEPFDRKTQQLICPRGKRDLGQSKSCDDLFLTNSFSRILVLDGQNT